MRRNERVLQHSFFGSVMMSGDVQIIVDIDQKAEALNALMQKLQPEKRYETILSTQKCLKRPL